MGILRDLKKKAELMKSLTLQFTGEILHEVLPKVDIKPEYVDPYEVIILGMFIVQTTYNISQGGSHKTKEQIDEFYRIMESFFVNELYLKSNKVNDSNEIEKYASSIRSKVNSRNIEYYRLFAINLTSINKTIEAFSDHLFTKKTIESKILKFRLVVTITVRMLITTCLDKYK